MKKLSLVFLSFVLCFSLFANGEQEVKEDSGKFGGDEVTLRLVMEGSIEQQAWMDKLIADFQSEYPNIGVDVNWISIGDNGWGGYFTKIKTMIASGQAPDVARVAVEGFRLLHNEKLAIPLNDYIEQHPEFIGEYSDIHTKLQDSCIIDGNVYGFAWDWNNVVTHINLDMLKETGLPFPADNWGKEDFIKYAKAMTVEKDDKTQFGCFIPNFWFVIESWFYNFGTSILTEDLSAGNLTDPKSVECIKYIHDLVHKYKVSPAPIPGDSFVNLMTNEQVAMTFGGRWPVPSFVNAGMNFDIQYVPTFEQNKVVFGSGMFPVMSASEHPEEAFIFSTWLSGKKSQQTYLNSYSIPSRVSVMDEVLPNNPPQNSMLYKESANFAEAVQAPARYPEVEEAFMRSYFLIMSDPNINIEQILEVTNKEINEIISR